MQKILMSVVSTNIIIWNELRSKEKSNNSEKRNRKGGN